MFSMEKMIVVTFFTLFLASQVSSFASCPKCGKLEVPYPFSTNPDCGNPNYKVYCNNDTLHFLSAEGFSYKILSFNQSTYTFIIEPPRIEPNTCLSSDLPVGGLKLDQNLPFNISKQNTVMLFNCSENIRLSPLNCSDTSPCRHFENVGVGIGCKDTLCCSYLKDSAMTAHMIRLRVGGCSAYTSVVNMKPESSIDQWNFGVELQWLPPN